MLLKLLTLLITLCVNLLWIYYFPSYLQNKNISSSYFLIIKRKISCGMEKKKDSRTLHYSVLFVLEVALFRLKLLKPLKEEET